MTEHSISEILTGLVPTERVSIWICQWCSKWSFSWCSHCAHCGRKAD